MASSIVNYIAKQGSDLYGLFTFLKRLTTPFNETLAYQLGIIDAKGKVLRKRSTLTTREEKGSYTLMDTLIFNMKKLMAKVPFGSTKLASYAASLFLLKEQKNYQLLINQEKLEEHFTNFYNNLNQNMLVEGNMAADKAAGISWIKSNYEAWKSLHDMDLDMIIDFLKHKDYNVSINEQMDPAEHVEKRDDKFVVVNNLGDVVYTCEDEGEAKTWAIKHHDELMKEDAPVNATGTSVAGTGDDSSTVVVKKKKKKIFNHFEVSPSKFLMLNVFKDSIEDFNEFIHLTGIKKDLLEFNRIFPNKNIILVNKHTQEHIVLETGNGNRTEDSDPHGRSKSSAGKNFKINYVKAKRPLPKIATATKSAGPS